MKTIQKIEWEAVRLWRLCVGVRLQRFVLAARWQLLGRARQSVREWRQLGSVPEWRPRRACRRLAVVRAVRVALGVGALLFGPWLLALLVRWLC